MTPGEILAALERGTLDPARFHHREHVLAAWASLSGVPFTQGASRFALALHHWVGQIDARAKYHETITWAWLSLVAERLAEPGSERLPSEAFLGRHPELLNGNLLWEHYPEGVLRSPKARQLLLLPDGRPR